MEGLYERISAEFEARLAVGPGSLWALTRLFINVPPQGDSWGFCLKNPLLGSLIASLALNLPVLPTAQSMFLLDLQRQYAVRAGGFQVQMPQTLPVLRQTSLVFSQSNNGTLIGL